MPSSSKPRALPNLGDGDDYIHDTGGGGEADHLALGPGIARGDVTLIRSTTDLDDLTLSFVGGGSVLLNEQFDAKYYGIESIDFVDGRSWRRAAMLNAVL